MCNSSNTGAKVLRKGSLSSNSKITELYIGVFFDGTNNNKIQTGIGRKFREQEKVKSEKGFEYIDKRNQKQLLQNNFKKTSVSSRSSEPSLNQAIAKVYDTHTNEDKKKYQNNNSQLASYTNVAILEAFYKTDKTHYSFYIEGSGSHMNFDKTGADKSGLAVGLGFNGVKSKVYAAFDFILNFVLSKRKVNEIYKLHFDVFGFSRGATAARIFNYIIYSDGSVNDTDLQKKATAINKKMKSRGVVSKEVEYLGIFDTVSSMGFVHNDDVQDYGLWATDMSKRVVHLCGMDEYRKNFAITNIESSIHKNGLELFLPGCHTDIGGGATIGRDGVKIINKIDEVVSHRVSKLIGIDKRLKQRYICPNPAITKSIEVSVANLIDMGWIDKDKRIDVETDVTNLPQGNHYIEKDHNVSMYRYVEHGYSNVALNIIAKGGNVTRNDMFNRAILKCLFKIPNDTIVKQIYKKAINKINDSKLVGRFAIAPEDMKNYQSLRKNYLHYSSNEQIATTTADRNVVNSPYIVDLDEGIEKKLITRLVYSGIKEGFPKSQSSYLTELLKSATFVPADPC